MKLLSSVPVLLCALVPVLAAPTTELAVRGPTDVQGTTLCGDFDTLTVGPYTFFTNLWGKASATSGSQCSTIVSISGATVVWSTSWTWQGGPFNVKSFSEIQFVPGRALNVIRTLPTTWRWSYTGSNIIADVAYDMWLGSTVSSSPAFEIMVWLTALGGAGPISATGQPIATVSIGPATWNLFSGQNGSFKVFSFVATSQQTNFNTDLKLFFNYLTSNQGVPTSQVLQTIDAGTEPFTGSNAVLTTSAFSVTMT